MRFREYSLLLAALGALTVTPGQAADFSDPTWPCVQRKVDRLSVGLMWPHPIEDPALSQDVEKDVGELVGRLTLRRLDLAEVEPALSEFTSEHGSDTALLGHVFSRAFDALSSTRVAIIEGIAEYSLDQIALSERIEASRVDMDDLMKVPEPDFDKVDALEEQIDWDERIYTDRQRSLTYLCETPVLLEKRLFAIAQMLLEVTQD